MHLKIISKVVCINGVYSAWRMGTNQNLTNLINSESKLKLAYQREGLLIGKPIKGGAYVWEVIPSLKQYNKNKSSQQNENDSEDIIIKELARLNLESDKTLAILDVAKLLFKTNAELFIRPLNSTSSQ